MSKTIQELSEEINEIKNVLNGFVQAFHSQSNVNQSNAEAIQTLMTEGLENNKLVLENIKALGSKTKQIAEAVAEHQNEITQLKGKLGS